MNCLIRKMQRSGHVLTSGGGFVSILNLYNHENSLIQLTKFESLMS